jgi:hypothetical protein
MKTSFTFFFHIHAVQINCIYPCTRVPFIYCKSKCRVNDLKQQFVVLYMPFKFVYINAFNNKAQR